MNDAEYIIKLKSHIHWEEGMDDTMLSFYIENAKKYIQNSTGGQAEYLVLLVAGIMYEYRIAERELEEALNAITPFIIQEVYTDGTETVEETTNEPT
jgi:hypothetical protein